MRVLLPAWLVLCLPAAAQYMTVSEVRPGMRGTGYTVFAGERVEAFEAEILGVLENAGPKQAIILARLTGGPLEKTGVMQGMSGSPVYVNGKLVGAVALAFPHAKEPIAGIRPFEEMRQPHRGGLQASLGPCPALGLLSPEACAPDRLLAQGVSPSGAFGWGEGKLAEIATPVSLSGFTPATSQVFASALRSLGLEPRQGLSGAGPARLPAGDPSRLKPGSMISVQLLSGDMSVAADGTVTHIEGNQLYAFGHRLASLGEVEMPFAAAEVLAVLPNLATSFKISAARSWLGAITHDYSTAVRGELGRKARMTPVSIAVRGPSGQTQYRLEMVHDATLTPLLLQMALFSALDATERMLPPVSYAVSQQIRFAQAPEVRSFAIYSGDYNVPMLAAQGGAIPVAYAMQSGFEQLRVREVVVDVEARAGRRQLQIEDIVPTRRWVRPGEEIGLTVLFAAEGRRLSEHTAFRLPQGIRPGTLYFTVSDGPTTNLMEYRNSILIPPKSPREVVDLLNALRPNTKAFVRVWRSELSVQSQGVDLPNPPPSIAALFQRSQAGAAGLSYGSKIAELEVGAGDVMVSGSKTASVEVRE